MPKLRINLRELTAIDELDLVEELDELEEREGREERGQGRDEKRLLNPVAYQRRQDQRKFGKDIARLQRERKSQKP
jgi:DNA gyrase/topoisomerase IV subunit A